MLTETHVHVPRAEGLQLLQRRGERGARELTTRRLTCGAGGSAASSSRRKKRSSCCCRGEDVRDGSAFVDVARRRCLFEPATALLVPPRSPAARAGRDAARGDLHLDARAGGRRADPAPAVRRGRSRIADAISTRRQVHNVFVGDPHARR
jgi:hypothetical protein